MTVRAGERDRRIVLRRRVVSQDSVGQEQGCWQEIGTPWAKVTRSAPGTETDRADQRSAKQVVTFSIRYRAGLEPKDLRVDFDGEVYDVVDVAEVERRRELVLTAYALEVKSGA